MCNGKGYIILTYYINEAKLGNLRKTKYIWVI